MSDKYPDLPLVLMGLSLGGMFAVRYAQLHQEHLSAIVLSAPVLGTWHVLDLLEHDEIPDTPIDPETLSRDPKVGQEYKTDPLVWHGPYRRTTLKAIDRCLTAINDGPQLDKPTLWIHGEEDELVPEADTRTGIDRIRGERFHEHIYPGARHELLNETNRDEVLDEVLTFIHRALRKSSRGVRSPTSPPSCGFPAGWARCWHGNTGFPPAREEGCHERRRSCAGLDRHTGVRLQRRADRPGRQRVRGRRHRSTGMGDSADRSAGHPGDLRSAPRSRPGGEPADGAVLPGSGAQRAAGGSRAGAPVRGGRAQPLPVLRLGRAGGHRRLIRDERLRAPGVPPGAGRAVGARSCARMLLSWNPSSSC